MTFENVSAPVRLAIVGCGAIADYLHLPAIQLVPQVQVCAVVDVDRNRAVQLARKFGIPHSVTDLAEVSSEVDAAVIAVPPHIKLPIVDQAFSLGLHVLCEKPLANTVRDCEQLIAWADASKRILAVIHQFRKWPNRRSFGQALRSGEMSYPRRVEVSQGAPYSWQSVTGYTVRRELVSGGVLINAGTHPLDTLLSWFGDPMNFEYWDDALGGLESNVRIKLEFPRDVHVDFRQSRTCSLSNEIRLIYDDHVLAMNNSDPFRMWERRSENSHEVIVEPSPLGFLEPAAQVYREFAAALRNSGTIEVDGNEGTRVIRLIESCYAQKRSRPLLRPIPAPGVTW